MRAVRLKRLTILVFSSFFALLLITNSFSTVGDLPKYRNDLDNYSFLPFDCAGLFRDEKTAFEDIKKINVTFLTDDLFLDNFDDCDFLFARSYYAKRPVSKKEEDFPLAYAILVNQDLSFIELLLSSIYMPQNYYCFHIDEKATNRFRQAIFKFAACFPNIIFGKETYSINRFGGNMSLAFMSCLKALIMPGYSWKYLFTMQGHDFPLRTNAELVQILTIHNGANDVELLRANPARYKNSWLPIMDKKGIVVDLKGSNSPKPGPPGNLTIYKGSVATALSYQFVDFVVTNPIITDFAQWINDAKFGDELFWSTLNHDQSLMAPGGYPGECLKTGSTKQWISRFAVWATYKHLSCKGKIRHAVCLFSSADLPMLSRRPELFLNKFWSAADTIAPFCMRERLLNRTYYPEKYSKLNLRYYINLPAVQFRKWRNGNQEKKLSQFQCIYCQKYCEH